MSVITQAPIIMLTAEDVEKGRMRGRRRVITINNKQ